MLGIARLMSGVTVALLRNTVGRLAAAAKRSARRRGLSRATRPMHGAHYRISRAPRHGGHCNRPAVEVLCPDGRWRRFVWRTNHSNPLCEDGRRSHGRGTRGRSERDELAREVLWLSDKFIGPEYLGPESAPDEGSLRSTASIGVYKLDPDCREANAQLGHPWHGRDYCAIHADPSVDPSWADRLGELRLLPCYDTVAGRPVRLERPSAASRAGAFALLIVAAGAIAAPLLHFVVFPLMRN